MSEYRIRATSAVVSEAELRAAHPDTCFPSPLTPDALEIAGADPVLEAPAPAITATQTVARNGVTQDAGGNWVTAWIVTDMAADEVAVLLASMKANLHDAVAARRLEAEHAGLSYDFPDGQGVIQTRDDIDFRNINGLVSAAMAMQGQGVTNAALSFRDQANVTHPMTPAQVIAMGLAVTNRVSATYTVKWQKDAEIDALADVAAAQAYDVNAGF